MHFELNEYIQMIIFISLLVVLFFVMYRSRKNDRADISEYHKKILMEAQPKPFDPNRKSELKKVNWMAIIFALFLARAVCERGRIWILTGRILQENDIMLNHIYSYILSGIAFLVMLIIIVIFGVKDYRKTCDPSNKVIIPAYVQQTFYYRGSHRAQIIYYDYRKLKFCLKTLKMKGRLTERMTDDINMTHIVVAEQKHRVKFVISADSYFS